MRELIHICAPRGWHWRSTRWCQTCRQRRWFLVSAYIWYPTNWTCLRCGDTWGDGERLPRPFKPGWRKESVTHAKRILGTDGQTKATARAAFMKAIADDSYCLDEGD